MRPLSNKRKPTNDQLLSMIKSNNVDAFDSVKRNHAEGGGVVASRKRIAGTGSLGQGRNNPSFDAIFDLQLLSYYFTLTGGAYTEIAAASLNAALKNDLPFFLFGYTDFMGSGYENLKGQYSINSNWTYGRPFIYGKDNYSEGALDATVTALLQNGDVVLPFTSALPGAGTTTLALHVLRGTTVQAGLIMTGLSSDLFELNGIRFILDDATQVAQYAKQLGLFKITLFGKTIKDQIAPNSFKSPMQYQADIVDIPLRYPMSKHQAIAMQNVYTNVSQSMSIFVSFAKQLSIEAYRDSLNPNS